MAIQNPLGTQDFLPQEASSWNEFQRCAESIFSTYGYRLIETPLIEQTDLFVRGIGEATDVVSKEMFTAISGENLKTLLAGGHIKNKSRMSLRPEGTAGVVRAVVQHDLVPQGAAPAKLMYAGPMFRAERPQKGRLREFHQIGIECMGAEEPTVDAEGIIMLMRFFTEIGIPSESMVLLLNSMGCENCRPQYREAVRAFMQDHIDEFCDDCKVRMEINPLRAFDCKHDHCKEVMEDAPRITDYLCDDCKAHYAQVKEYLEQAGLTYTEDYRLVRGLDYYTRTVFEVQVNEGTGSQNAIGGGGRYDKLALEVGGRDTPGFGWALGYERCALALEAAGVSLAKSPTCKLFIASVDDSTKREAFALLQACRDAGIIADMSHQARSLKSQFKLADKLDAKFVAVLGPEELENKSVKLRDMATHEEQMVAIDNLVETLRS
ncbi:MAG: histidine--tRNA ligase [Eggerthellaceae bacterium]|jgi:histidyl-tRNA synthetase